MLLAPSQARELLCAPRRFDYSFVIVRAAAHAAAWDHLNSRPATTARPPRTAQRSSVPVPSRRGGEMSALAHAARSPGCGGVVRWIAMTRAAVVAARGCAPRSRAASRPEYR